MNITHADLNLFVTVWMRSIPDSRQAVIDGFNNAAELPQFRLLGQEGRFQILHECRELAGNQMGYAGTLAVWHAPLPLYA